MTTITDHALLRYLERVVGIDIDAARAAIAGAVKRSQGAPIVRVDGVRYVIRRGQVVAVLAPGQVPRYAQTARAARLNAGLEP